MDFEHYFDWAATAPSDEKILRESLEIALQYDGNPSATHKIGASARKILEEARESCAKTLGVSKNQVIFTSGGTESDHIPLLSILNSPKKGRIILSAIEHPALREECAMLKKQGFEVVSVNPDKNGFVTADSILENLTPDTLFVTVMAVNNETGCVQPVCEIADAITKWANGKKKPHFHVDCVQAAGKIPLDLSHKGIDSAALSAHKISGPRGIGILYLSKPVNSFLVGGGQEQNIRSGTENLFGAVAFAKCLEKFFIKKNVLRPSQIIQISNKNFGSLSEMEMVIEKERHAFNRFEKQKEWTVDFLKKLKSLEKCRLVPALREDFSEDAQSHFSPWVVQAAFLGIPGNVMVRALDAKGFCISTGSACSAKKQSRPILAAMNASREIQDSAVRFSFGPATTKKAMDELFEAVKDIVSEF
ncbi:cysteine desulfurase [Treponema ruminis]|uniref:Cysteine desulfurase n=1 Tax=Treponema ruminis TaxID=744515 RepID=A0A7W8G7P2_9SPIR|nr:cysteine desulfurase family protein [Treponema ruminis]MBB5225310.1 cysteine desulfurase [Treponema ruminis]QSI01819.1 cysteine desulfurase [Treponema ruminis]